MFRVFTCLTTQHDWRLVFIAALVCLAASFCAIGFYRRARRSAGRMRKIWILTASCATGFGIWATHFIAMLAYEPGIPISYDAFLTVLSLFAAIAITCIGLGFAVYSPFA